MSVDLAAAKQIGKPRRAILELLHGIHMWIGTCSTTAKMRIKRALNPFGDAVAASPAVTRTLMIVSIVAFASTATPVHALAQPAGSTPTQASDEHISNVWALAGINARFDNQWQAIVRFGYLGGLESRIFLADLTFAPKEAWPCLSATCTWILWRPAPRRSTS